MHRVGFWDAQGEIFGVCVQAPQSPWVPSIQDIPWLCYFLLVSSQKCFCGLCPSQRGDENCCCVLVLRSSRPEYLRPLLPQPERCWCWHSKRSSANPGQAKANSCSLLREILDRRGQGGSSSSPGGAGLGFLLCWSTLCSRCSVLAPGVLENPFPWHGNSLGVCSSSRGDSPAGQSHCAARSSSTTFQKYLLRDFLVFRVLAGLGLLLCATKKEDELAFPPSPVNIYSPKQAVKMLLLSWVFFFFWCLFLLPRWNVAPESPTLAAFVCAAEARGCS